MDSDKRHIYPVFEELLQQKDKESLLNQQAKTIWMTGLSGSGKTTIAKGLERCLHEAGFLSYVLDGDNIRSGLNGDLGFSAQDRTENIRRIAEVSKLFNSSGVICINSFVSPTKAIREQARKIIGANQFIEVFVNTPLAICEERDVKGLYKKARSGELKEFTGISAPFEAPSSPDVDLKTENRTPEESVVELFELIRPKISVSE